DLYVAEPTGSVCSPLARQTVGGGTLIGDTLSNPTGETYVAAQAFPGEYTITVERVWGRPLGGKAQLKSILNQGPEDDAEQMAPNDRTLYQTRVAPFVKNSVDVTAQAVLSADRRYVRLSMTPVFNAVANVKAAPVVTNPTLPGAP